MAAGAKVLKDIDNQEKHSPDGVFVLRTVNQNQMQLIVLADQKANILIGVVAVIFTILFTKSEQLLNAKELFMLPFFSFSMMEVVALLLAFLVITPKTRSQYRPDSIQNTMNPLYFGCFTQFDEDDYVAYLSAEVKDDSAIKELLIRDIYHLGVVLKKKYTLLKYAYVFAVSGAMLPFVMLFMVFFSGG